jgi:hypothetical protein
MPANRQFDICIELVFGYDLSAAAFYVQQSGARIEILHRLKGPWQLEREPRLALYAGDCAESFYYSDSSGPDRKADGVGRKSRDKGARGQQRPEVFTQSFIRHFIILYHSFGV